MSAAPKLALASEAPSRRNFVRYPINVPLDVIILRSGVPDSLPGRCTDISEAGIGAIVAGELNAAQAVAIELRLPNVGLPIRTRAQVRYHDRLRCGFEFIGLSPEQSGMIRYWAYQNAPEPARILPATAVPAAPLPLDDVVIPAPAEPVRKRTVRVPRRLLYLFVPMILALAALGWWNWKKEWQELESQASMTFEPQSPSPLRVPSGLMEKRILSKRDPVYPEAARLAHTEGLVILGAVIASDGSVKHVWPVSGPYVLAESALDAVQTWRFEPYRSAGEPVEVETTIAVEFRLH